MSFHNEMLRENADSPGLHIETVCSQLNTLRCLTLQTKLIYKVTMRNDRSWKRSLKKQLAFWV